MPRQTLGSGPWKGVRDTTDPYDDPADPGWLQDAQNCYVADVNGISGIYARPGFVRPAPTINLSAGEVIAMYTMTAIDGTVYRFAAAFGKLYRFSVSGGNFTAVTDVTPAGITIDAVAAPTARFYITSYANQLVFSDGVNRPWLGTNLGSTPITGTYIDIDGAGGSWSAQGKPTEYKGSLFFIAKTVPAGSAVNAGVGIVWCEPNQPAVGYTQSGYANFWNLIQTSSAPLYALYGTNVALYYFREFAIGALAGTPGGNFATTATEDAVSFNVGCTAPASVVGFGNNVFFVDTIGRPWMFAIGEEPKPIWQQLRGQIDANPSYIANPTATALMGQGVVVPQLNMVLLGGWSSNPVGSPANAPLPPSTLFAFDGLTGTYFGRWTGGTQFTGFDAIAVMKDGNNATTLIVANINAAPPMFWVLSLLSAANWLDSGAVPTITAKTQRLGYSADTVWNADMGRLVTMSAAPVTVTVQTPYTASTTECTAQASATSQDSTRRIVFGMDVVAARGIQVTASPTTATTQWGLQRIEIDVSPCRAGPEDA